MTTIWDRAEWRFLNESDTYSLRGKKWNNIFFFNIPSWKDWTDLYKPLFSAPLDFVEIESF